MRAIVADKERMHAVYAVALATAIIVLYSVWGATVMSAQREQASTGASAQQLALK